MLFQRSTSTIGVAIDGGGRCGVDYKGGEQQQTRLHPQQLDDNDKSQLRWWWLSQRRRRHHQRLSVSRCGSSLQHPRKTTLLLLRIIMCYWYTTTTAMATASSRRRTTTNVLFRPRTTTMPSTTTLWLSTTTTTTTSRSSFGCVHGQSRGLATATPPGFVAAYPLHRNRPTQSAGTTTTMTLSSSLSRHYYSLRNDSSSSPRQFSRHCGFGSSCCSQFRSSTTTTRSMFCRSSTNPWSTTTVRLFSSAKDDNDEKEPTSEDDDTRFLLNNNQLNANVSQDEEPVSYRRRRASKTTPTTAAESRPNITQDNNNNNNNKSKTKRRNNNNVPRKFQIVETITNDNMDKLAAAFDELARKEGFGSGNGDDNTSTYFANDVTFEDEDDDDEDALYLDDDDDDDDDDDYDESLDDSKTDDMAAVEARKNEDFRSSSNTNYIDPSQFRLTDFIVDTVALDDQDKSRSARDTVDDDDTDDSMDARIASARMDMQMGQVSVPKQLDRLAASAAASGDSILGFQTFDDEVLLSSSTQQRAEREFQLVQDAMVCGACGADYQSSNVQKPGYLPPDKFAVQVQLGQLQQLQRLQNKAENDAEDWSAEDEIEWLIQTASGRTSTTATTSSNSDDKIDASKIAPSTADAAAEIDIGAMAESMGLDLDELNRRNNSSKRTICQRCHGLQNFGTVDTALRPGWTQEPLLSQTKFRDLLRPIREKDAVIIALVDIFDFAGSVLSELDHIAGDNPVILAANKADLLPSKMGQVRVENWVRRELEYMGIQSLANIGGAVRLVSCKTGFGIRDMLAKARTLANKMDCDIYVVGAANAGKSTLLNHILGEYDESDTDGTTTPRSKLRAGNRNKYRGMVTTSPLPGTTLKFIQVDLGNGRSLYDTPGLLVPGTLTQLLTPEELKIVVPKSQVEPVTFRVASGKAVLVGGLAKVEIIGDCKPFLLTFFVANGIKLHPTDSLKADEFVQKHVGEMLVPPLGGPDRLAELGTFVSHVINVDGTGWKESAADIALTGLGWISVTGAGQATVQVSVPRGVGVTLRPPLMPFDVWESTARYTGSRAVRKSTSRSYGKKRHPGVGRN